MRPFLFGPFQADFCPRLYSNGCLLQKYYLETALVRCKNCDEGYCAIGVLERVYVSL
jgi:hypothetical protein